MRLWTGNGRWGMSDELRAAAERYRTNDYEFDAAGAATAFQNDAYLLAEAYFAERPADDEEPVTREKLKGLSVEQFHEALMWSYDFGGGLSVMGVDDDPPETWKWTLNTRPNQYADIKNPQTCGDVRRLFAALGVELNEEKETA